MRYTPDTKDKSIFLDILEGRVPGVVLFVSDRFFAILPHRAATQKDKQIIHGHTLLIPRQCGIGFEDFSPEQLVEYALLKQLLTRALLSIYDIDSENFLRIGGLESGFEIKNHYHAHLIPAISGADVSLQNTTPYSLEERQNDGKLIQDALKEIQAEYPQVSLTFPENK